MDTWLIVLLVVLGVITFIVLPAITFHIAGKRITEMLKRGEMGRKGVKMDVSFYDLGPLKEASQKGLELMDSLGHEDVYLESFDGLKLHAYLFRNKDQNSKKFLLGMHGYKSGPRHEYAPYIKDYLDNGYSLLLPDERSHYLSEGEYITMGAKERYDCLAWANYLVETFGSDIKILMQGISMGAATVCLASNLDLPKQVYGIISDCAYSSFEDQIRYTLKHTFKIPCFPILNIIGLHVKRFGLDFKGETPKSAVKNSKVPILFCQGAKDEIVPKEFVDTLYENCGNKKRLYIVENANHAESYARDKEAYFNEIKEFFKEF